MSDGEGTAPRRPLREFLRTEAAGGVVLMAAAAVALVWANSPWQQAYVDLWDTELTVAGLELDLGEWINDGLMTVFFFVVGLEIKRELVEGELRERRRAALPAIGALGGMVVPALLYTAINAGGDGRRGWGIPMATDIAVALGVLSLLGRRVHPSLRLYLLAIAIVDDVGAIVVIAIFYSGENDVAALLASLGLVLVVAVMRRLGVRAVAAYAVVGVLLWVAVHESGVHATIAGVVLGLMAPTGPAHGPGSASVVESLEHRLHPLTSFVIVPLFALANAGVPVSAAALSDAASSPITAGVVVGLVVGKPVGIVAFTWLAARLRLGELPPGATPAGVVGVGAVAGMGFTVSLFVTALAFDDVARQDQAKIGILVASVVAAILATLILRRQRLP